MSIESRIWVLGPIFLAITAIVASVVFDLQLTAERWMGLDLLFRSTTGSGPGLYPVADPSPWSIAVPTDRWLHASLRAAELPLWDPTQGGGYSPAVQGNVGVFFPLRWLTVVLPVAQAPTAFALLSIAFAYFGTFLYCRSLQLTHAAAGFAGLCFATSAHFVVLLVFDAGAVMLFLPWLLYADRSLAAQPTALTFAGTATVFALAFLSGHHMVLFVVFIGAAMGHVFRVPKTRDGLRESGRFLAASLCGAALAAVALLPFAIELSGAWLYKVEAEQGASYIVPRLGGWWNSVQATAIDVSSDNPICDAGPFYVFLGPLVGFLAVAGAAVALRNKQLRPVGLLCLGCFVIALPGPWMEALSTLPPLKWVRNIYAFALLATASSVLAGVALDRLLKHARLNRLAPLLVLCALVAAPLVNVTRNLTIFRPGPSFELPETDRVEFLRENIGDGKLTASWGHVNLPNAASWTGLPDARIVLVGFDERHHLWWELVNPDVMLHSYPTTRMTPTPESPLLGAFGVRFFLEGKLPHHVFMTSVEQGDRFGAYPPRPPFPNATVAYEDDLLRIYEVPNPRPRAYLADEIVFVDDIDEAAEWVQANPSALVSTTVIEGEDAGAFDGAGTVSVVHASGRRVELEVDTPSGGVVVFNERFDDGWSARVDGRRRPILPANVISRAVIVEPGQHKITMRFTPPGFVAGCAISLLAALGLLAAWRRERRRPTSP